MRVLHLFDVYLHGTMNWAFQLMRHTPGVEQWAAAPWLVYNQFHIPDFQYIQHPWQQRMGWRPTHENDLLSAKKLLLALDKRLGSFEHHLRRRIRDVRPDLLHAHFGPVACRYADLAVELGVPLVASFYGYDYEKVPFVYPKYRTKYQRLFRQAVAVTAMGPHGREVLIRQGSAPERTHVVPLGIDSEYFTFKNRPKSAAQLRLLQIATFTEKKGFRDTLAAFRTALPHCPGAHLTLAGELHERQLVHDLQSYLRTHALTPHVTWLPPLEPEQVPALLQQHDVFIQPSHYTADRDCEGGPVSVLEALVSGLPVIATRHFDLPNEVPDGVAGLLANEHDVPGLAAAIRQFYQMESTDYEAFSERGRAHVKQQFEVRQSGKLLHQVYQKIAHNK